MDKILETLKKLSGWVTGGIGFLVALIAAIILFRDNPQLTAVVIIIIVDIAAVIAVGYIQFYKTPSQIIGGRDSHKYSKNLRVLTLIGLVVLIAANAWFFVSPFGEKAVTVAIIGTPTLTPTIAPVVTDIKPAFEINFIGLPYKDDNAYYVTDAIVNAQGNLSAYSDFELTPPTIEIVPHYSGDEKFGNIVLRVSGDSTNTKNIPLWSDFDGTAQTQTVNLDLADIIKISGIKKAIEELDTNLMLREKSYQEANLRFEIIRLSEPDKPYGPKLVLPIKNSPWIERVSVLSRNGMLIDYALENLGSDATFYCRINITKTLSDVSESEHVVWSGTKEMESPKCVSFTLKTGETYKVTIPLNQETLGQELSRGRYIVQVYTFAERRDLIFKDGYNYENSNNLWVIANPGDVRAFIICSDPGKSCADSVTLPIEQVKINVFPFSSNYELGNGYTNFVTRTYPVGNRSVNQYILYYSLDPQKEGWVGFGIWFEDMIDVSRFNSIRLKLILDQSKHPISFDVKYKVNDTYITSRTELGSGKYGISSSEEQTVIVPFTAFEGVDWTEVDTLNFIIDSYRVPDAIQHKIQISEIEFIR